LVFYLKSFDDLSEIQGTQILYARRPAMSDVFGQIDRIAGVSKKIPGASIVRHTPRAIRGRMAVS
jgi:hypothetical protein